MDRTKQLLIWKKIATLVLFLLVGFTLKAQEVTTSGTVVDTNGEPLIGVSVMAQGTAKGTTTDLDGHYTITVNQNTTLVFSYVGMTTQSLKAVNGTLDVTLKSEATSLDEMVVVGYVYSARVMSQELSPRSRGQLSKIWLSTTRLPHLQVKLRVYRL